MIKRYTLIFLTIICLSSCSPYKPTLTVGAASWPSFELLFLAKELHYLDPSQFSLFELPSSSSVMQAFQTGKTDIALLSLDEVLTLIAQGIDLKIISIIDHSISGYALMAKPEIQTVDDLKWHSIGYENKAAGALLLAEIFNFSALTSQTTTLIEVKQHEAHELYLKDNIDALIVREPQKQQLLALGAREMVDSSILELPITHVIVARADIYSSKEAQITLLIKGFYQAYQYYLENRKQALASMSVRLQLYPYLLERSFQGLRIIDSRHALMAMTGSPSDIELQAKRLSQFMIDKQMLGKIPTNLQRYISTKILEEVVYE